MFYESHLTDLTFGKTTAVAIRQEPQGRIPVGGTPPQPGHATQSAAMTQSAPAPGSMPAAEPGASTSASTTLGQGGTAAMVTAAIPGVDAQAQLLVPHDPTRGVAGKSGSGRVT